jgi:hypothetical protein
MTSQVWPGSDIGSVKPGALAVLQRHTAIDLPQPGCNTRCDRNRENHGMIRNLAIAVVLALTVAIPAHEAAAQNTLGGAIVGGVGGAIVGGAIGGGRGAAIGAVIGAGTGAAIAAEGERRRGGYYYYRDGCYMQRPDGAYVLVDPRYCY